VHDRPFTERAGAEGDASDSAARNTPSPCPISERYIGPQIRATRIEKGNLAPCRRRRRAVWRGAHAFGSSQGAAAAQEALAPAAQGVAPAAGRPSGGGTPRRGPLDTRLPRHPGQLRRPRILETPSGKAAAQTAIRVAGRRRSVDARAAVRPGGRRRARTVPRRSATEAPLRHRSPQNFPWLGEAHAVRTANRGARAMPKARAHFEPREGVVDEQVRAARTPRTQPARPKTRIVTSGRERLARRAGPHTASSATRSF